MSSRRAFTKVSPDCPVCMAFSYTTIGIDNFLANSKTRYQKIIDADHELNIVNGVAIGPELK